MKHSKISLLWVVPALLAVFLVAAIVTFTGELKSNYVEKPWKEEAAFTVESSVQVMGTAKQAARIEQAARRIEHVTAVNHSAARTCREGQFASLPTCQTPSG